MTLPNSEKSPPDNLPGRFDDRVFIGGNYDNMVLLRKIKKVVAAVGYTAILPRDDVAVPLQDVHDWDLRILHNCRFAIFEVSVPAGELMEIERVRDYGTQALLIYQSREAGPPEHITKMIRTCKLPLKGYFSDEELPPMIKDFFSPFQLDPDRDMYLKIFGYWFEKLTDSEDIQKTGMATEVAIFEGLHASGDKPVTEIEHEWELTSGEIISVTMEQTAGIEGRVKWQVKRKNREIVEGAVVIDPALKKEDSPLSYKFTVVTRGAYCFTREEYMKVHPDDPFPFEALEKKIFYPTKELVLRVSMFEGYPFRPRHSVMYGAYQDADAANPPMTSFEMETQSVAKLTAIWPKIQHRYVIAWELEAAQPLRQ